MAAGQPLGEDQRSWFRWLECDGAITALEVVSPQPFSNAETATLQTLRRLYGSGRVEVPLRLTQLEATAIPCFRQLRTATPMLLYTTPRPGKLQRSPAGHAIQSLLWGLGEQGKLDPSRFGLDSEQVWIEHTRAGRISARVLEVVANPGLT